MGAQCPYNPMLEARSFLGASWPVILAKMTGSRFTKRRFLHPPSKYWDYRCSLLCLVYDLLETEPRALGKQAFYQHAQLALVASSKDRRNLSWFRCFFSSCPPLCHAMVPQGGPHLMPSRCWHSVTKNPIDTE